MHRIPLLTTGALLMVAVRAGALSPCFASPEAAAVGAGDRSAANTGYRLISRRRDPLIGRNWVTIESCDHPERPAIALATGERSAPAVSGPAPAQPVASPMVMDGETVRIRYSEGNVRIEMGGVAQASGNPGDTIRVRLIHAGTDSGSQTVERQRTAIVRGPNSLELQP